MFVFGLPFASSPTSFHPVASAKGQTARRLVKRPARSGSGAPASKKSFVASAEGGVAHSCQMEQTCHMVTPIFPQEEKLAKSLQKSHSRAVLCRRASIRGTAINQC